MPRDDEVSRISRWVVWNSGAMPLFAAARTTVAHYIPAGERAALCGASSRSRSGKRRRYAFDAHAGDVRCTRCTKALGDG